METAALAAVAMLVQDLLAVLLVQAEARNRAVLSGVLDCVMWPAGMITTAISVTALQGHHTGLKAEVLAAVTIANFAGSAIAVTIGKRFIKAQPCGCPCMAAAPGTGQGAPARWVMPPVSPALPGPPNTPRADVSPLPDPPMQDLPGPATAKERGTL